MRSRRIAVGVIGDFDQTRPSHLATNRALAHGSTTVCAELEIVWLPTRELETEDGLKSLQNYSGLWGAPGNHASSLGMIRAIQVARQHQIPYLGT